MTDPRPELETGVWFGVDVGTVRVGVARSDPGARLAVPVETLVRDKRRDSDVERLAQLTAEHGAVGVVIGEPTTLAGRAGPSVAMARAYGARLSRRIAPVPVLFVDERLSTVLASRRLADRGMRGRSARSVVDQAAAVEILQLFLDSRSGGDPGPTTPAEDG